MIRIWQCERIAEERMKKMAAIHIYGLCSKCKVLG